MKNIFKNILFSILVIALFFLSLELIQRVRYWRRYDSAYWLLYGFVSKPKKTDNYKMQLKGLYGIEDKGIVYLPRIFYEGYSKFNPDYPHKDYEINSLGFRNYEFNPIKSDNIYRIVIVGDSTVFGLGSNDNSTFPMFLQNKLREYRNSKNIEVINCGIPSFTAENMKNIIKAEILDYSPNLIIIYGFFNDIYYSDVVFKKDSYFLTLLDAFLLEHSVFYRSLREKLCKILDKDIGMLYRGSLEVLVTNLMANKSILRDLNNNLQNIIDISKEHNTKIIIVKQALWLTDINIRNNGILESDKLKPFYDNIYLLIDKIGDRNSVQIISANESLMSLSENKKDKVFWDGVHLTAEGNELLASTIFEEIKNNVGKKE